ncbi:MAG: nucleobase:cation symporter-2 family protein [Lachnospiraceae bacterium]|nr:nucleobase:cation symporter-2 family protein [Lachnospiraceae bacterium]
MSNQTQPKVSVSVENIYQLDGRVPVGKAIPFGLQHVLAMFVSNLVPVLIVASAAVVGGVGPADGGGLSGHEIAQLLQCAMFVAGIGTIVQLYPVWKVGSKLPVVMGVSFTFLGSLLTVATNPEWGYEAMIGAIIVGGIFEGCLGLTAKYWRKFIQPVVSACVVTTIGFSLLSVGMNSFGGGQGAADFGAWYNITVAFITLVSCLIFKIVAKGVWKNLNVLFGLAVGYVVSVIFTVTGVAQMVNFASFQSTVSELGFFSLPLPVFLRGHMPTFHIGAIITVGIVFLVSAAETIGDTTAVCTGGLGRDITEREVQGSLACDGFCSALSGVFGCNPITSFSQNVGLVAMTKVVNRFTILMGALVLVLCSLFPPIGAFFNSLPNAVLGGCTVMMFGSIIFSGVRMIADCGHSDRNMMIVALSFCIGIGVTMVDSAILSSFPPIISGIFAGNPVAGVFVISMILSLVLPKDKEEKKA